MKILHVPFTFYPDAVGGTEIYVASLAKELTKLGDQNIIAAPSEQERSYVHDSLNIHRYALDTQVKELDVIYGKGDPVAEASFDALLAREKPDIVHLHALTSAVSLRTLSAAKRHGIPVVFTYHTPTVTCARGTLLRWGNEICDGKLDARLCTQCLLQKHGFGYPVNAFLSAFPTPLSNWIGQQKLSGHVWTALQMRRLVGIKHITTLEFLSEVDRIIVLCRWTEELLLKNGLRSEKIFLSRHGLADNHSQRNDNANYSPTQPLKLMFLGRIDPTKGLDVVIRAIGEMPKGTVRLDIYGVTQVGSEHYRDNLVHLANGISGIEFHPPVQHELIFALLKQYDFLIVPSQWLETGPLVVLEAFAAGIPVLGSNLGGIAELVHHDINGLLVEPGSLTGWKHVFERILGENDLCLNLRMGIVTPRTMSDVALDMKFIYLSSAK